MKSKCAFTLIELLIVVAIIGILAAIAVPNFMNAQIRAKLARVQSDHKAIATAQEAYRIDNNTFTKDAHWNNRIIYKQLSKPVIYLSVAPLDPFTDDLMGGQASGGSSVQSMYQMGTGNSNQPGVGNPDVKNTFLLVSNGPDKREDTQPITPYPMNNPQVPNFYMAYESSNGLISRGDVWRFGGEAPPNGFREAVSYNF